MAGEAFAREPFVEDVPGLGNVEAAADGIVDVHGQAADAAGTHLAQSDQRRPGNPEIEQERGELEQRQAPGRTATARAKRGRFMGCCAAVRCTAS